MTKKAVEYIWKVTMNGDLDKDPYSLNLAAYALALAKSDKIFEVLRRRDDLLVYEGNFKQYEARCYSIQTLISSIFSNEDDEEYWKVGEEEENVEESSLAVQAASYAVLTSLAMNDLEKARPLVNFILRAMKPNGVFVTSQVKCCNKKISLFD